MLRRHERLTGCKIEKMFADSTHTSAIDLAACQSAGIEMYGPYQENSLTAKRRGKPNPDYSVCRERFVDSSGCESRLVIGRSGQ